MAVVHFGQTVIRAIAVGRKRKLATHDLHGLPSALQRAGDVVERCGLVAEQLGKNDPVAPGLRSPRCVEMNVALPLVALRRVPVGLAVPDEEDRRLAHRATLAAVSGVFFS